MGKFKTSKTHSAINSHCLKPLTCRLDLHTGMGTIKSN